MDYEQLNAYIDNWLDSNNPQTKTALYSFIAACELQLSINEEPFYLYNDSSVYICSANKTLNLSKRLLFEIEQLRDAGFNELILLVPSYTRISRDVKARIDVIFRYDVPKSYHEYMNTRARNRRSM